ncbi:MAG: hypothetical protein RLZZ338_670 [Cyanobacteriota bacterium]
MLMKFQWDLFTPNTKPTILIVDDNIENIQFLELLLESQGYSVACALNAEEALQRLDAIQPDLILLDLFMPYVNGLELCKQIKTNPLYQEIPIIFLTVSSDEEHIISAFENGAADYVKQPCNSKEVLARLDVHIKLRQQTIFLRNARDELWEANLTLEKLSLTDPLTGLPNRRSAMASLSQIWAESIENNLPLVCMMIDADYFKEVNDNYGHDQGDIVLIKLATTLKDSIRTDDIVSRLGGDEFMIICPNTNHEGGWYLANLLYQKISELSIPLGSGCWRGSVSIGLAVRTQGMKDYHELIKAADQGVFSAKKRGKSCVYLNKRHR